MQYVSKCTMLLSFRNTVTILIKLLRSKLGVASLLQDVNSCAHHVSHGPTRGSTARSLPVSRHCSIELAKQWRDESNFSSSSSIFASFHRAFTE
jgi:hypothetical protein